MSTLVPFKVEVLIAVHADITLVPMVEQQELIRRASLCDSDPKWVTGRLLRR
jgi:hypothetical protein